VFSCKRSTNNPDREKKHYYNYFSPPSITRNSTTTFLSHYRRFIHKTDAGTSEDYDILKALWKDWFERLEIKNVNDNFFILRNNRTIDTRNEIDKFINDK
jgi:hypothetical protein